MPAADTQFPSDLRDRTASFVEHPDLIKQRLTGGVSPVVHQTFVRRNLRAADRPIDHGLLGCVSIVLDLQRRIPDRRFKAAKLPLDGFAKVLHQMEAISDLSRLRRTLTRGVRIKISAITANNLDFWMLPEPISRGVSRAIR
jgi:hypothetical protein